MKRDGVDFGNPPPAVVAYIHQLEGKVVDLEAKVDSLGTELSDTRSANALWLVVTAVVLLCISYWGLQAGWKLVPLAIVFFVVGVLRYREQRAWEQRRFDAIMKSYE